VVVMFVVCGDGGGCRVGLWGLSLLLLCLLLFGGWVGAVLGPLVGGDGWGSWLGCWLLGGGFGSVWCCVALWGVWLGGWSGFCLGLWVAPPTPPVWLFCVVSPVFSSVGGGVVLRFLLFCWRGGGVVDGSPGFGAGGFSLCCGFGSGGDFVFLVLGVFCGTACEGEGSLCFFLGVPWVFGGLLAWWWSVVGVFCSFGFFGGFLFFFCFYSSLVLFVVRVVVSLFFGGGLLFVGGLWLLLGFCFGFCCSWGVWWLVFFVGLGGVAGLLSGFCFFWVFVGGLVGLFVSVCVGGGGLFFVIWWVFCVFGVFFWGLCCLFGGWSLGFFVGFCVCWVRFFCVGVVFFFFWCCGVCVGVLGFFFGCFFGGGPPPPPPPPPPPTPPPPPPPPPPPVGCFLSFRGPPFPP